MICNCDRTLLHVKSRTAARGVKRRSIQITTIDDASRHVTSNRQLQHCDAEISDDVIFSIIANNIKGLMPMWLDEIATEAHLKAWIKHCPAMKLVSTIDGQIVWANAAFCDWSQYTLTELKRLTWMQISVPDKNLEADISEVQNLDAYNPSYQIKKQYIPKGSKPEWGLLTVMRYPLHGEIECCLCTWEPLKNGTAAAFAVAMEHAQKLDARLAIMATELQTVTSQTDEDKYVLATIRMMRRYPKVAAGIFVVLLSIFGLNNVVELLQRTGLLLLPQERPQTAIDVSPQTRDEFVVMAAE